MNASSLKIVRVAACPGLGGYYFDDQAAIIAGAVRDGHAYVGAPMTGGFDAVRQPAEVACVMLELSDGYIAIGDCASVQYSGVGGREPRLCGAALSHKIETDVATRIVGLHIGNFRAACELVEEAVIATSSGRAAAYGLSQALLDAAAHAAGHHVGGRVIMDSLSLDGPLLPVPIYGQCGEDRHVGVDKMLLKQVPVLPHGLINTADLVGHHGEALVDYILFVRSRVSALRRNPEYNPIFHLDVYGMIGAVAGGSINGTADILQRLEQAAGPHQLRIEHPMDGGSLERHIETMVALRTELRRRGSSVETVVDEWANTVEDIAAFADAGAADLIQIKTPDLGSIHHSIDAATICAGAGIGTVIGGTCAETDISARTSTHLGMALSVAQLLAKPGMGVDEGLSVVTNEMNRAARLDEHIRRSRTEDHASRNSVGVNA